MTTNELVSLPPHVQKALDHLVDAIKKEAKDNLASVLVHGSAVRGGYREETSDIDLVLVLENDPVDLLHALGPHLLLARSAARIETMILKRGEIQRSADVFPLLYQDIAQDGVALAGTNPFEGLRIADEHLRLRIEQELREARIRLRVAIADAAAGLLRTDGIVDRKMKQLRSPLAALLRRAKKPPAKTDLRGVIEAAADFFGVEKKALFAMREKPDAALDALLALLDAAIQHIDREEVTP
jgi:predicted nucleotidyltransferase